MTIQIHLPDETLAALITQAQAQGRPAEELAADALSALFAGGAQSPDSLDDDALARLRQGFADLDAGRTLSLADARTALQDAFQNRYHPHTQAQP